MARGYRRYGRRRRNYPMRKRGVTRYKRGNVARGSKFRMRMKLKLRMNKWQKYTWFANILPAHNLDAARVQDILTGQAAASVNPCAALPAAQNHDPMARRTWFGLAYAPGGAGAVNAVNNPTTVGNGILNWLNAKDQMLDHRRWDYSAFALYPADIVAAWDRMNNVPGAFLQIPVNNLFVKGVKINALGRDIARPGLCYLTVEKPDKPFTVREQVGKIRGYIPTKKLPAPVAAGGANIRWSLPIITVSGPVYTRIRITMYYKLKKVAVD